MIRIIGSGNEGNVYLAKSNSNFDLFAIKIVQKRGLHGLA
jgi:hypothetical protein